MGAKFEKPCPYPPKDYEAIYGRDQYRRYVRQCKGLPPPPPLGGESSQNYFERTGIQALVPLAFAGDETGG